MVQFLIFLYVIDTVIEVPTGCFVAAWVITIFKAICAIIGPSLKISEKLDK